MISVEHDFLDALQQMFLHGMHVRVPHIHGHRGNAIFRLLRESGPESFQTLLLTTRGHLGNSTSARECSTRRFLSKRICPLNRHTLVGKPFIVARVFLPRWPHRMTPLTPPPALEILSNQRNLFTTVTRPIVGRMQEQAARQSGRPVVVSTG